MLYSILEKGEFSPFSKIEIFTRMIFKREKYINKLISHQNNKRIKIITGIRRCGKSYLLFELFKNHLKTAGVKDNHIIEIQFDDIKNKELRDADKCYKFVTSKIKGKGTFYVLLDEVQMLNNFTDVLNGFLHITNLDVYVTGSNSKFLSSDVATEFRGRGDEIRIYPLSFSEYNSVFPDNWEENWKQYYTYGGLPYIALLKSDEEKISYLQNIFQETYLQDIIDRNKIKNTQELNILVDILASSIGSLTNPQKLSDTFKSNAKINISAPTLKNYCNYLQDAFLIKETKRYDGKGKQYINTPFNFICVF